MEIDIKRVGEDRKFAFDFELEDGTFEDLDGYSYYAVIVNGRKRIKVMSGTINGSGEVLLLNIPANETYTFPSGNLEIQFEISHTTKGVYISDVVKFTSQETLKRISHDYES